MSAQAKLVSRFVNVFGMPDRPDPHAFLGEFVKALDGLDGASLEKAGDKIIRTATFWPRPSEVVEEYNRVVYWQTKPASFASAQPDLPRPSADAKARVREMVAELKARLAMSSLKPSPVQLPPSGECNFKHMQETSPNVNLHRRLP